MNNMNNWWRIDATIVKISKWSLYISVATLVFLMLLATVDIICTKFFSCPISGTSELIEDMNIPLVYLGMAFVQLDRGHIAGPVFESVFPKSVTKAITIAGHTIGIFVCGVITWRALPLLQEMISNGETKTGSVQFYLWPFALITFFSFALLTISYILSIVRTVTNTKMPYIEEVKPGN